MPNSSHGAADSADFVLGIIKHHGQHSFPRDQNPGMCCRVSDVESAPHSSWEGSTSFPVHPQMFLPVTIYSLVLWALPVEQSLSQDCVSKICVIIAQESVNAKATNHSIFLQVGQESHRDLCGIYEHWAWQRSAGEVLLPGALPWTAQGTGGALYNHMNQIPHIAPHCPTTFAVISKYKN